MDTQNSYQFCELFEVARARGVQQRWSIRRLIVGRKSSNQSLPEFREQPAHSLAGQKMTELPFEIKL